ncbi:MAG TPA: adenylyltransferase/cytidyltransferase family protein [Spirochaetia bacterium]|nr:adenylyltransferase/cytidyltransferase family protein [Spirochaetia bacterium]
MGDTLFSSRAIFIEQEDGCLPEEAEVLSHWFRLVQVTERAAGGKGPAPCNAAIRMDSVETYIHESSLEWYASWYVGNAPAIGFHGVLPGGPPSAIRTALRAIGRAEARSRILVDQAGLSGFIRDLRGRGKRVVFTNGVFDLLHAGHLRLLEHARGLGDSLVVAINSDDSARRLKGPGRPVIPQFARAQIISSLRFVDACFIFPEADPMPVLRVVRPDVLVKGSEYTAGRIVGARFVSSYGGTVVRLPMVRGWSTTSTIRSISGLDGASLHQVGYKKSKT